MFYQDTIRYNGEPLKAILTSGGYLCTITADDVPVTHLTVFDVLGIFTQHIKLSRPQGHIQLRIKWNNLGSTKFIGEQVLIYDALDILFNNSCDAGASVFQIEVVINHSRDKVVFVISDDGKGIAQSYEHDIVCSPITTKANGSGYTLYLMSNNIKKIGSELKYHGKGLNGCGAKFKLYFIKEMPTPVKQS